MRQERIVRPRQPRRRRNESRERPAAVAPADRAPADRSASTADQHDETDEVLRRIDAALGDPRHVDRS